MSESAPPSPFSAELVDAGFNSYDSIMAFKDYPGYLARDCMLPSPHEPETTAARMTQYQGLLDTLANDYGIVSAYVGYQAKEDPEALNGEKIAIVTRRVDGVNMAESIERLPEGLSVDLIGRIISYYEDVAAKGGVYFGDLSLRQFMFGTTADDPVPKPYLIDLNGSTGVHYPGTETNQDVNDNLSALFRELTDLELTYDHDIAGYRERLLSLRDSLTLAA